MVKELIVNARVSRDNPPKLRVSTSRLDFGNLPPNQMATQHIWLENAGGPFSGTIKLLLKPDTEVFKVDCSATVGLIFPIKVIVDANTFVSSMEDLGPHTAELIIDIGSRQFEIPLAVQISPFQSAAH